MDEDDRPLDPAEFFSDDARDVEPSAEEAVPEGHRSGYVALIGPPNVGKSTLLNALVGKKLAIVTDKPSTTRHRILGIRSEAGHQLVFLDTPGVIRPRYRLHDAMMHAVDHAVADADVALFLVDVTQARPADEALERATHALMPDRPVLLVLNKMDRIAQEEALPLVEHYLGLRTFAEVVPISALTGWNVDVLLEQTLRHVPLGPPYYPKDQLSEHPERFFVAEIVREKVFEQTRDEIPYATQVNVVVFEEREHGKDFVDCEIVLERESQKAIVIGKGGSRLKKIGAAARQDIEAFTGRPVYLQLHVKARADWRDREGFLRQFGYEG